MPKSNQYGGMIFIVAPREISQARFKQLIRHYLPKAPIVLGVSKEPYVSGFEGQPQFRMLQLSSVQSIIDKTNEALGSTRVNIIEYSQVDLPAILSEYDFSRVLLINGSWQYTFHNHPAHRVLLDRRMPFKYISPFVDEAEAKAYEQTHSPIVSDLVGGAMTESSLMERVAEVAKQSYDYSFQTGAVLARLKGSQYHYLLDAFNMVVPYQTYALHHGNSREKHIVKTHDANHYDTIHAEMHLLTKALGAGVDIKDATIFINLLPCPNCARTLSQTGIREVAYQNGHSGDYAVNLLQASGVAVRRVKPPRDSV